VVAVVFGLDIGVAEAVVGGFFSFCSPRDLPDLPEEFLLFSFLSEEEEAGAVFRGAMLLPFSEPEGEIAACEGCAASMGAA
jgi:hypothetical protein